MIQLTPARAGSSYAAEEIQRVSSYGAIMQTSPGCSTAEPYH